MAKDNLFLGMARGKVGDVVFSRINGQQVTRARNRAPRNPMTVAQMVQRIILNTSSKAYSLLQELTNHSFEGKAEGMENQQEFMRVNVAMLREVCARILAQPTVENMEDPDVSGVEHFNYKGDYLPVVNPYVISQGTLPSVELLKPSADRWAQQVKLNGIASSADSVTYSQAVAALGLLPGDQLTFVALVADGANTDARSFIQGMVYARVILAPDDGDMSKVFLTDSGIQNPNSRNEGAFDRLELSDDTVNAVITYNLAGASETVTAPNNAAMGCVIVSRFSGGRWLRSSSVLRTLRPSTSPLGEDTLYGAWLSYLQDVTSGLYLNQART